MRSPLNSFDCRLIRTSSRCGMLHREPWAASSLKIFALSVNRWLTECPRWPPLPNVAHLRSALFLRDHYLKARGRRRCNVVKRARRLGTIGNPEVIHISEKSPYAANLCPLSGRVEFAGCGEDFGESIGEL